MHGTTACIDRCAQNARPLVRPQNVATGLIASAKAGAAPAVGTAVWLPGCNAIVHRLGCPNRLLAPRIAMERMPGEQHPFHCGIRPSVRPRFRQRTEPLRSLRRLSATRTLGADRFRHRRAAEVPLRTSGRSIAARWLAVLPRRCTAR